MPSSRKATTRISGSWIDAAGNRSPWLVAALLGGLAAAGVVSRDPQGGGPLGSSSLAAQPAVEPDRVAGFMRAKLAHSQDVLEGLSLADFDLIEKGAQELSLASQDSSWQVLQTEDYARQSAEFRRSCDSLRKAAREKNLDGASAAYVEMVQSCLGCHKALKNE